MNKIAIVTGANSCVGIQTTKLFLNRGVTVIMACTNLVKGLEQKQQILTKKRNAEIDVMELDLSELDSINKFKNDFIEKYKKFDLLIYTDRIRTRKIMFDNKKVELQFSVNFLGKFFLTNLLLPYINDFSSSRILTFCGKSHKRGKINTNDLTCKNNPNKAYEQSQLSTLMITDLLNTKLEASNRNIKTVCIYSYDKLISRICSFNIFKRIIDRGFNKRNYTIAKGVVNISLKKNIIGGGYYKTNSIITSKSTIKLAERSLYSSYSEIAKKLWVKSEEILNKTFTIN